MTIKPARKRAAKPAHPPAEQPMSLTYEPLAGARRWPRNPKLHDQQTLSASFERWGYVAPIIVDAGTGLLVAGHGRVDELAARKARGEPPPDRIIERDGDWLVPVVRVRFKDEAEAAAYLLADNEIGRRAGWQELELAAFMAAAAKTQAGLVGTGFSHADLLESMKRIDAAAKTSVARVIETTTRPAEFYLSVRGPVPAQPEAIQELRKALANLAGCKVDVGLVG